MSAQTQDRLKFHNNSLSFYNELYSRNWPIIDKDTQAAISKLNVTVAGCGSTGGAFIDGALRLGVSTFTLTDNGAYELNNLNRQMTDMKSIDVNKAMSQEKKIRSVNPEASVTTYSEGVTFQNVDGLIEKADIVFDAVDVTTSAGMKMKLLLHERCAALKKPVASALDLGYTQWLQSYNYQKNVPALFGRLEEARSYQHPLKALIGPFCEVESLPLEITIEVIRLMKEPGTSACQLGCACFLLAALTTPYLLYFIEKKELPPLIEVDLLATFHDIGSAKDRSKLTKEKHSELKAILAETV